MSETTPLVKELQPAGYLPPDDPYFSTLRGRVWRTMRDPTSSPLAMWINNVVMAVIVLSIVVFCVSTLPEYYKRDEDVWFGLEAVIVAIFTLEYVVRLVTAPNALRWILEPLSLIDLLAILPFYIELGAGEDSGLSGLAVVRAIRLVRLFRIFKNSKLSVGFRIVSRSLMRSSDALSLLLFLLMIGTVLFGALIYFAERGSFDEDIERWVRDDGTQSPFQSIPHSFWWCIVTFTTVGYGDHFPVTGWGKLVGSVCVIVGILVLAFPVAIVGDAFSDEWDKVMEEERQLAAAQGRDLDQEARDRAAEPEPEPVFPASYSTTGLRYRIYDWFENPGDSMAGTVISLSVMVLIAISIVTFCVQSLPEFNNEDDEDMWLTIEAVIVGLFTLEYLTRLAVMPFPLRWAVTPLALIDLLAIVPFYVEVSVEDADVSAIAVVRVLRLVRVFRVFKLSRYNTGFQIVAMTFVKAVDALFLMLVLLVVALVVFGSLMYYAERGSWDDDIRKWLLDGEVSYFQSIPHAFWWCLATMTTVGYGDEFPVTIWGKLIAVVTMLGGILVVAFPVSIVGVEFNLLWAQHMERKRAQESATESKDE